MQQILFEVVTFFKDIRKTDLKFDLLFNVIGLVSTKGDV